MTAETLATTIVGENITTAMYGDIFDDDQEEFFDALRFGEGCSDITKSRIAPGSLACATVACRVD